PDQCRGGAGVPGRDGRVRVRRGNGLRPAAASGRLCGAERPGTVRRPQVAHGESLADAEAGQPDRGDRAGPRCGPGALHRRSVLAREPGEGRDRRWQDRLRGPLMRTIAALVLSVGLAIPLVSSFDSGLPALAQDKQEPPSKVVALRAAKIFTATE